MSQNDPCGEEDLAMVGDEGFGAELLVAARGDDLVFDVDTLAMADDEGFGDELLAIDVDSLVAARETQRVEQVEEQLREIVATLVNCHAVTSLPLTTDQLERFSRCSFWADTFSAEMRNVRASAIERFFGGG